MNARLPESMERRDIIGNMEVGETRYTVPWAMWADEERRLWLIPGHSTEDRPGGTVQMRITRVEEGFRVLRAPGHVYDVGSGSGSGKADRLPVVELEAMDAER